jgi:23S rRNA pseudouridine2604 synthase
MRINKYLANAGVCSRREADKFIESGKVFINGERAVLGQDVSDKDKVKFQGKFVSLEGIKKIYIAFNKPYSVITTTDLKSPNNIMEYVNAPSRVYPVGRLDVKSTGLILLTNDGDLVNRLLKAENRKEKEYMVMVNKPLEEKMLEKIRRGGILMDGRRTLPAKVEQIDTHKFSIIIVQGIKRQIRRVCENLGYIVMSLKRVRIAGVELRDLKEGKWRFLTEEEVKSLS